MTLLTRSRGRNRSFGAFTPSSLFLGGIQGAWYDPSDVNTTWRRNLLTRTEQFATSPWGFNATTATNDAGTDPLGGSTASRIQGAAGWVVFQDVASFPIGTTTISVWVKSNTGANQQFRLILDGGFLLSADLTATTSWQRFSYTATTTYALQQAGIFRPSSGAAADLLVWGAQLEVGSSATAYQQIVTPEITYASTQVTNLFQDAAGLTPVWAVEQPVGSILDKRATAYSSNFSGSSYFSAANSSTFALGTGDFTWEAWIYPTAWSTTYAPIFVVYSDTTPGGIWVGKNGSNFVVRASGIADQLQYGTLPTTNVWTHVAVVRSGTTLSMYYNGTRVATTTNSYPFNQGPMYVGSDTATGIPGYVSNLRLVKGSAVYDATKATLTVPTGPLSAIANTLVLTCGTTWSGNPAWTNNGATVSGLNPFTASPVGNHAYQSTAASRPVLRARYNLLTYSEDFGNAAWTKANVTVTLNSDTAPDGTITADTLAATAGNGTTLSSFTALAASYTFSVYLKRKTGTGNVDISADGTTYTTQAITSSWARYTVTQTLTAGAKNPGIRIATNGDEVYAWGAQLLTAADATATGNAYQRIEGAATYATGGVFRPYLAFDGVDDGLATNAVDFTATDKMSVFAGANKTSDAAFGVVAELSATIATNNGSFLLSAPNSAAANYNFSAGGTARVDNVVSTYAAPITNVITGLANIAAPSNQVRINGASIATVTTTQGTGAFGNYPMYFGRRNNATNPFNGRIYGLIVRGAASSAVEVAQTESWLNAKTGAY